LNVVLAIFLVVLKHSYVSIKKSVMTVNGVSEKDVSIQVHSGEICKKKYRYPEVELLDDKILFKNITRKCNEARRKYPYGSQQQRNLMKASPKLFDMALKELASDHSQNTDKEITVLRQERTQAVRESLGDDRKFAPGTVTHARILRMDVKAFNELALTQGLSPDEIILFRKERRLAKNRFAARGYRHTHKKSRRHNKK
jgi:hypothetical protein